MSVQLTALVVWILGLVLYALARLVPKLGALAPLGLICFGVGLFLWLQGGAHVATLR